MKVRRVVTGHQNGHSVVVADEELDNLPVGESGGDAWLVWGRDEPASYPDAGAQPEAPALFPPVGGCRMVVLRLAPGGSEDFDTFVTQALAEYADAEQPGMHRTASLDFDIMLSGEVVLELDDGNEVTLRAGDIAVQNGTRHRWENRGSEDAVIAVAIIGAEHELA